MPPAGNWLRFSGSIPPWLVLSHNMPTINTAGKLASFWHFSLTASSLSSHSLATDYWPLATVLMPLTTVLCATPHAPPAGSGRAQDPPPLATACHRQPNWQRPNGARSRRAVRLLQYVTEMQYVTEPGNFFGQIHPLLPARRLSIVDHSLVAGGARRQWFHACLQDGCQRRCLSSSVTRMLYVC